MKLGILGTGTIVQELLPDLADLGTEKAYLLATPRSKERAEEQVRTYQLTGAVYDYEAPGLAVACRGGEACGFENFAEQAAVDGTVGIVAAGVALREGFVKSHDSQV